MSDNDTLLRQWLMLRLIPRHPRKAEAREITERLHAEGYDVSKRTVERDLRMLSEKFPLLSDDREKPYGWSWKRDAPNLDVPGMSPSEALTFMLAKEHLKPFFPAPMLALMAPYFDQAALTLGKADSLWARSRWTEKIAAVPPVQPLMPPQYHAAAVDAVHEALLHERQIQVRYQSRAAGAVKEYQLHPLGIVLRGAVTYLVATIDPHDNPRSFALHRIEAGTVLESPRLVPQGFSLQEFIAQGAFGFQQSGNIRIILRFAAAAAEHLRETPISTDQVVTEPRNGMVTVTAMVLDTQQLRWWILGFGGMVEVISPVKLRREFRETAEKMAAAYRPDSS
jgi:predicted DNA-binding transcriptional regulator YafY